MSERKNGTGNIQRLLAGPKVLVHLKEAIRESDPAAIPQVIDQVLSERSYTPSRTQRNLISYALPHLMNYRRGVIEAQQLHYENPDELTQWVARQSNNRVEDIERLDFHLVSVGVALNTEKFGEIYAQVCRDEGIDKTGVNGAVGLANINYALTINSAKVPYSLEDSTYPDSTIGTHEDVHVQNRLIFYQVSDKPTLGPERYKRGLAKRASEAWKSGDRKQFQDIVREVTADMLDVYFNELSASAVNRSTNVYYQFINPKRFYRALFEQRFNVLKVISPRDVYDLEREWIIWQEIAQAEHKMRYIDMRYERLARAIRAYQLVALIQTLTPKTGYAINAFLDGPKTFSDIKRWKKDFEGKFTSRYERISSIAEFLNYQSGISDEEYRPIRKYWRDIVDQHKEAVYRYLASIPANEKHDPASFVFPPEVIIGQDSVEGIISDLRMITQSRVLRLQGILEDPFLNKLNLSEKDKAQVVRICFMRGVNFQDIFLGMLDSYCIDVGRNFAVHQQDILCGAPYRELTLRRIVSSNIKRHMPRSLSLDDAAEEIVEDLFSNTRPNWDLVFSPGFSKSDEKRKRALKNILRRDSSDAAYTSAASPLEEEAIFLLNNVYYQGLRPHKVDGRILKPDEYINKIASLLIRIYRWKRRSNKKEADKLLHRFSKISLNRMEMYSQLLTEISEGNSS